ncbi:MAG TPA: CRISPR system precrRNA processing endoribonuclease RAMP protein Cas6 [Geobacterales bacterium]|nr:CRISPR system precrRNA processing endoribonuclease RAMP protein Cas6 [Geobacterales bacterium]
MEYLVEPIEDIKFESFPGYYLRGLFFNTLKKYDEKLALRIHESQSIAPYSIKIFQKVDTGELLRNHIKARQQVKFSFTILDENLFDLLKEPLMVNSSFRIAGKLMNVREVNVQKKSFSDILSNSKPLKEKFAIDFLTPTSFRLPLTTCCKHCHVYKRLKARIQTKDKETAELLAMINNRRGIIYPLPDIKLAFYNIVRLIKRFEVLSFNSDEFNSWLDVESVVISGFENGIKTLRYYEHKTSNKFFIGFIGKVNYYVRNNTEDKSRIANALLSYAELTNVGPNRTAGFGSIRLLN